MINPIFALLDDILDCYDTILYYHEEEEMYFYQYYFSITKCKRCNKRIEYNLICKKCFEINLMLN